MIRTQFGWAVTRRSGSLAVAAHDEIVTLCDLLSPANLAGHHIKGDDRIGPLSIDVRIAVPRRGIDQAARWIDRRR